MVIGGVDSSSHTKSAAILNYNDLSKDFISKSLTVLKIGDTVINYNAGAVMHDLIIDSGSSASLLDTTTINQVTSSISAVCSSLGE